jgi:hypothetical protein
VPLVLRLGLSRIVGEATTGARRPADAGWRDRQRPSLVAERAAADRPAQERADLALHQIVAEAQLDDRPLAGFERRQHLIDIGTLLGAGVTELLCRDLHARLALAVLARRGIE